MVDFKKKVSSIYNKNSSAQSSPTSTSSKFASVVKQTIGQSTAIGAGSGRQSTPTSAITRTQVSSTPSRSSRGRSSRGRSSRRSRPSTPTISIPQSIQPANLSQINQERARKEAEAQKQKALIEKKRLEEIWKEKARREQYSVKQKNIFAEQYRKNQLIIAQAEQRKELAKQGISDRNQQNRILSDPINQKARRDYAKQNTTSFRNLQTAESKYSKDVRNILRQNDVNSREAERIYTRAFERGALTSGEISVLKEFGIDNPKQEFTNAINQAKTKRDDTIKGFNKKVLTDFQDQQRKIQNSPEYKAVSKQSMTPTELKVLESKIKTQSKELTKKQFEILKNLPKNIGLGVSQFGKNLPKDIGLGVYEFGKETLALPFVAVKGAYNFGFKKSKQANDKGESILKTFGRDIKTGAITTKNISVFVAKNPLASAVIVGAVAGQIGGVTIRSFLNNPVKFTTKAALYILSPKAIGKAIGKVGTTATKVFNRVVNNKSQFVVNNFQVTQKVNKLGVAAKSKITGTLKGADNLGTKYTATYVLRKTDKGMTGSITYRFGKEKIQQRLNLIDKGSYYLDTISKKKITKDLGLLNQKSSKIKTTKLKATGKEGTKGVTLIKEFDVTSSVVKTFESNLRASKKITTTTRQSLVRFAEVTLPNLKNNKNYAQSLQITKSFLKKYTPKTKTFNSFQLQEIKKFLNFIEYDKKILGGLNKTERLAKSLGINIKKAKEYNTYLKNLRSLIKRKPSKTETLVIGKLSGSGRITQGDVPLTQKLKSSTIQAQKTYSAVPSRRLSLSSNKKGSFQLGELQSRNVLRKIRTPKGLAQTIQIPRLQAPIRLLKGGKINYKGLGRTYNVLLASKQARNLLSNIAQRDFQIKDLLKGRFNLDKLKQLKDLQIKDLQKFKVVVLNTQKTADIQKTTTKTAQKPKMLSKLITTKTPIRKLATKSFNIKTPIPEKPIKLPTFKFKFNDPILENRKASFVAFYRERKNPNRPAGRNNPVIVKQLKKITTRNRMKKIVADLADRKAIRTIQVGVAGISKQKIKDIAPPKVLKKFTKAKSKKIFGIVEKAKYALDSKTERRELRSLKAKKKATKPKTRTKPRKSLKINKKRR